MDKKKVFWPAFRCSQHSKAGLNTQKTKINVKQDQLQPVSRAMQSILVKFGVDENANLKSCWNLKKCFGKICIKYQPI